MASTRSVLRRLLSLVPVLVGVASLVFSILYLSPGDPALTIVGEHVSEEFVRQIEESLGLNDPIWVQYGRFLVDAAQFQFGESLTIQWNIAARKVFANKLPVTLELVLYGQLIGISLGIPLSILSAAKQDSITGHLIRIGTLAGISVLIFWNGPLLVSLFAQVLGQFPTSGRISVLRNAEAIRVTGLVTVDTFLAGNWDMLVFAVRHMILPASIIGVYSMAFIPRMMRSSMLEVVRQDYMRTVRAKGQGAKITVLKHGFRSTTIPVITVTDIQFGGLPGGAVFTETAFVIGGIGTFLVEAIKVGDYSIVQGTVLTFASLFTLVNLGADITCPILDPRIE